MARQSDLRFTFTMMGKTTTAFDVIEFDLQESLSRPYLLEVKLSSFDAAIDFGEILNMDAALTIWRTHEWREDEPVRHIYGLVTRFEQGASGHRRTYYTVRIEPFLATLGLYSDWRIFQERTVPEILNAIFRDQGVLFVAWKRAQEHLTREYCVQAGESDLDFCQRLAAEEGIVYYFEHTHNNAILHLTDDLNSSGNITGPPVLFNAMAGGDAPEPSLWQFHYAETMRTSRQTLRDYSFFNPGYNQEHSPLAQDLDHQGKAYVRYDYPGRYKQDSAGKPFAENRLRGHRRDARLAQAQGDDARLQPGLSFTLSGHPRDSWNTRWRVLSVHHRGIQNTSQEEDSAEISVGTVYDYHAEILPIDAEWRPEPTAKPRIDGPQIATVVGAGSDEIYCDDWGRSGAVSMGSTAR